MTVIMQGISSGSLIYVTCFEVLQRHGSGEGGHLHGIRNTLFVILGYCFVLVLKVVCEYPFISNNLAYEIKNWGEVTLKNGLCLSRW